MLIRVNSLKLKKNTFLNEGKVRISLMTFLDKNDSIRFQNIPKDAELQHFGAKNMAF